MTFHIITIFPEIFNSYFNESIIKRAQETKKIKIKIYDLRDYTEDKHKTVDDSPFGGGAGMVMKVEPLYKAVSSIKYQVLSKYKKDEILNTKIVLTSAKGKTWNQSLAQDYSQLNDIIIICGRYEGVDERILNFVDEEISIGDYVLTGGEIPAMTIIDSVSRLIPGVLNNEESPLEESHSRKGIIEYPHYTRPQVFIDEEGRRHQVPKALLSGNHKKIAEWKSDHSRKTKKQR